MYSDLFASGGKACAPIYVGTTVWFAEESLFAASSIFSNEGDKISVIAQAACPPAPVRLNE